MVGMRVLSGFFLIFLGLLADQKPATSSNYKASTALYHLGRYDLQINQYKMGTPVSSNEDKEEPFFCRAEIEVLKKGREIGHLEFKSIQPYGSYYGIFAPKNQESRDHLIFVKQGDYDGRTIVITNEGQIVDLPGGLFRIFRGRYLISPHCEDSMEFFTIYDLETNMVLLDTEDTASFKDFYSEGNELFVMLQGDLFFRLDFSTGRLIEATFDKNVHRVFSIDQSNLEMVADCECPKK